MAQEANKMDVALPFLSNNLTFLDRKGSLTSTLLWTILTKKSFREMEIIFTVSIAALCFCFARRKLNRVQKYGYLSLEIVCLEKDNFPCIELLSENCSFLRKDHF